MNMKKIKVYKTISIPHLFFTVYLKDMSELKGIEKKGAAYTCQLGEEDAAVIFVDNIEEFLKVKENISIISHEIIHVLQMICEIYDMDFRQESEHMAYLMTYLLVEIFNLPKPN